ncbi:MarR family winged helix-turn-helix transcriptional regulator [Methylobacterium brachythecii]|uniref:MarR family transcriptional regulator n=1 Tax=Methylobacterium brachythecii TaxID=1176177 RepID=A0A7W6F9H9_9HYPH|nr:MarR family transcriptional regulator [Methylobacterium brachythecii]MBB3905479.1 DNA-binding MarR family transcriptional regulator [Methylobacterium brachythecii]GLS44961.1 MarR family transcriptional regulator [Methylobacterium brachythecii]
MTSVHPDEPGLSSEQYAAIADFRFQLRRFLAFSESAAMQAGLPPQQHQALLAIAGHRGEERPSVGVLARQLLIAPNTAAELVHRMEQGGLLTKTASVDDRRRTELGLTPKAEAILRRLTVAHLEELRVLEPALVRALGGIDRAE